jgi:hypothetical protein
MAETEFNTVGFHRLVYRTDNLAIVKKQMTHSRNSLTNQIRSVGKGWQEFSMDILVALSGRVLNFANGGTRGRVAPDVGLDARPRHPVKTT